MESEALFIALLIAPWALALIVYLYYRQRQLRKTGNRPAAGREDNDPGV